VTAGSCHVIQAADELNVLAPNSRRQTDMIAPTPEMSRKRSFLETFYFDHTFAGIVQGSS
jgi:hypothetical protein